MKIYNQIFETLTADSISGNNPVIIERCNIGILDFDTYEFVGNVIIRNCIIKDWKLHNCWFLGGLLFESNVVLNYLNYEIGGHNKEPILINKNIFSDFVSFFDCHFEAPIELSNNIFVKGSNLLGNKDEGFHNLFSSGVKYVNNIGNLAEDGLR